VKPTSIVAALGSLVLSSAALAAQVPYCSVTAVEGQNYIKFANNPTPGVTPESLCELAKSELRFNHHLTPTGAYSRGWIDTAGQNYAWVRCADGFVQYTNAFGLNIANVCNQLSSNHFQCLFHINHNG
jgi:hypothetical protein